MPTSVPLSESIVANGLTHHVLKWPHADLGEHAHEDGAERGVVFLLHGYMDAAGTWQHVAPLLAARGYDVIAPDFRGFGAGARIPSGAYYHFADYIFDVADLTRAFAPSDASSEPEKREKKAAPLIIVGHSMGGTVSTMFTGSFPERVTKLALLEGLGPPQMPDDVAPLRVRKWIDDVRKIRAAQSQVVIPKSLKPMTPDEALARLAMNHPRVPKEILRDQIPHLTRREQSANGDDGGLTWAFDPLHKTPSPTPFSATVFGSFARAVTCPTLFVSGGANGFHPPDEEERLAMFAHLTRREIKTAGHMMHWTEPAALAAILLEFLA